MENGQVKNQEPISNNNNTTESQPSSGSVSMEDTVEFRLMMAYAQRRHPKREVKAQPMVLNSITDTNPAKTAEDETQELKKTVKKKKKKFGRGLHSLFMCIKPQTDEKEPSQGAAADHTNNRCLVLDDDKEQDEDEMNAVAARVMGIVDQLELTSDIESDNQEDEVERVVGLLLREAGDHLNEKFKEADIGLEGFLNYNFFRMVVAKFLERMGYRNPETETLGPRDSPAAQIAVTCEITSRLSVLDTLPRNRLLNHGAQFLKDYYSHWAQQQGGYEATFQHHGEELD